MIDVSKLKISVSGQWIETDEGFLAIGFSDSPAGAGAAKELCAYTMLALKHYSDFGKKP